MTDLERITLEMNRYGKFHAVHLIIGKRPYAKRCAVYKGTLFVLNEQEIFVPYEGEGLR